VLSETILTQIAERVIAHGVRSLRADLAVVRASRALAALEGAPAVEVSHVDGVLPLALAHRAPSRNREPRQDPPPGRRQDESPKDEPDDSRAAAERVFVPVGIRAPRLEATHRSEAAGASSPAVAADRGPTIGVRRTAEPRELDARATLVHAATHARGAAIVSDDLHERRRAPIAGTRYLFVVDSSGSHAVQERMSLVKGAVNGLLDATHGRHDEIVVIACRGASASVLVEPTAILDDAQRTLEYMPTGGRTPLAHAIELAATYVTDHSVVVIITDGHANVPSRTDDPWADTLTAASAVRCPSLIVDSEDPHQPTGRSRELAAAMGGRYLRLADLDHVSVLRLIRETA
jgi:magnesium chelatase subunit D